MLSPLLGILLGREGFLLAVGQPLLRITAFQMPADILVNVAIEYRWYNF